MWAGPRAPDPGAARHEDGGPRGDRRRRLFGQRHPSALPRREGRVFLGPQGGAADLLVPSWKKARAAAQLVDFRFHDLRHTAASYLAMSGATEREIAELLGHRTMAMVKRYSHLSKEHVAGLVGRLEASLLGQPSAKPRRRP